MHSLYYQEPFELWKVLYLGYIMWTTGLLCYFFMASQRDGAKDFCQITGYWWGKVFGFWLAISIVCAGFFFPLLFVFPLIIVKAGAPLTAGIISGAWGTLCLILSGNLMFRRRRTFPA